MTKKKSSEEQAVSFGIILLNDDDLHESAMKALDDGSHLPTISREFTMHSQIDVFILEHNGDNNCSLDKKGAHF